MGAAVEENADIHEHEVLKSKRSAAVGGRHGRREVTRGKHFTNCFRAVMCGLFLCGIGFHGRDCAFEQGGVIGAGPAADVGANTAIREENDVVPDERARQIARSAFRRAVAAGKTIRRDFQFRFFESARRAGTTCSQRQDTNKCREPFYDPHASRLAYSLRKRKLCFLIYTLACASHS